MSDTDQKKTSGKQARNRKPEPQRSRKADKRAAKAAAPRAVVAEEAVVTEAALTLAAAPIEQMPAPEPVTASLQDIAEQVAAPLAPAAVDEPAIEVLPPAAVTRAPRSVATPATAQISIFSLAQAYGDYTRKSYEQTRSFFDRLTGVRSFDKAVEVHAEFAKEAIEAFVSQTEKIGEIHRELAMQRFRRFEGLMAGTLQPAR